MARVGVEDPRIRKLVEERLIPLYLDSGSVHAVCERLNTCRPRGSSQIYPNRVLTLLSLARDRSVNGSTLKTIEQAAASAPTDGERAATTLARLTPRVVSSWRATQGAADPLTDIAAKTNLPQAVVRSILRHAGQVLDDGKGGEQSHYHQSAGPDYTFQDDAVRAGLNALRASMSAKTAIVVPTGGTKTRIGLRIGLAELAGSGSARRVVWITHRRNLRDQARGEMQKMLTAGVPGLPADAAELLATRVDFIMLGELPEALNGPPPALVIVDEAHHAAAKSYRPLFETQYPLKALFLTATPNRTDGLPLGIDSIAYTVTYRELADRGVILIPKFEEFPVKNFDWTPEAIQDLADVIIDRTADDFAKTLVLAPRVERVEEFYEALLDRLDGEKGHPLTAQDIGFVHGARNSVGCGNEEFLAVFRRKPRAILVSAQLLVEGFDDPAIDSVVITYPSSSLIQLMQAAGRCVRYSEGKFRCCVIQAKNENLAYHFDHRWLYQEISDELRPALEDVTYASTDELRASVDSVLETHHVPADSRTRIAHRIAQLGPGETCRLLLCGLPYFGDRDRFAQEAEWEALLEITENSTELRWIFNDYCARSAEISDPTDVLAVHGQRFGFDESLSPESRWTQYSTMLMSLCSARRELFSDGWRSSDGACRPFRRHGSTTWLKYITFRFTPSVSEALRQFLADCHNAEQIVADVMRAPGRFPLVVKLPLPLGMKHAFPLDADQGVAFDRELAGIRGRLESVPTADRLFRVADALQSAGPASLPFALLSRMDRFLEDGGEHLMHRVEDNHFPAPGCPDSINTPDER